MISLLVAATENDAIGKDGQLLWHLPNDLKYFKNLTWGMVVIMDSPQFSSLIAQTADPENKASALTIVNCIGFSITIITSVIRMLSPATS